MEIDATRRLTYSAFFIAAGLLLPVFFHFAGLSGSAFLPMHIPVLLGGLLLEARAGLLIGLLVPLLSSVLTGMPPLWPSAPMMAFELGLYGLTGGWLHWRRGWPILGALLAAMAVGRLGMTVLVALFADSLGIQLPPLAYLGLVLTKGAAGIGIQLLLIPLLLRDLRRYLAMGGGR